MKLYGGIGGTSNDGWLGGGIGIERAFTKALYGFADASAGYAWPNEGFAYRAIAGLGMRF